MSKVVGSIDIPVTETSWGTWSYNITEEDLKIENCKTFGEFLAKVRTGEICIVEYDADDYETHDSELRDMEIENAEGYDHTSTRYIKQYEDPCEPQEGD